MKKKLFVNIQHITPKHGLSALMGKLAETRVNWLKNYIIRSFSKLYKVSMNEALVENLHDYPTFNDFFTRQLKHNARPICTDPKSIASPADGTIAELGKITDRQLLQAKNSYFNLDSLFGGDKETANLFQNGDFATIYLAPHNYHRVHMPVDGTLIKSIYVPGKLFSVNRMTTDLIPNLYCRNERLISLFDTAQGPMAVIMVGALIVGSMQTVWMQKPVRGRSIMTDASNNTIFKKGDELGHFKLGSTVVLLFAKDAINWLNSVQAGDSTQVGQIIGQDNFPLSKAL